MTCKGVECIRHKAKKPYGMGRYESGQSRCQECAIFILFNGRDCPCCGTRLRKNPRGLKYKTKLRESNKKKYGVKMDNE